jgi:poly-gamma-glutamate synthesis protein (capsule biosynthesis protein)
MRILFLGDVMLGRLVNETLKKAPPDHPWGMFYPFLRKRTFEWPTSSV